MVRGGDKISPQRNFLKSYRFIAIDEKPDRLKKILGQRGKIDEPGLKYFARIDADSKKHNFVFCVVSEKC